MSSARTITLGISSYVFLLVSTPFEPTQSIVVFIHWLVFLATNGSLHSHRSHFPTLCGVHNTVDIIIAYIFWGS